MFLAIAPTTPRSEWRKVMGVSEARLRELVSHAAGGIPLPAVPSAPHKCSYADNAEVPPSY